jgi:hypothetical protein
MLHFFAGNNPALARIVKTAFHHVRKSQFVQNLVKTAVIGLRLVDMVLSYAKFQMVRNVKFRAGSKILQLIRKKNVYIPSIIPASNRSGLLL